MCCMRLAENTGLKNDAKKSSSGHHRTGCIFAIKALSTIGKKFKQQYLFHMSSQYGEHRPTSGWDRLAGLGHPSKFQRLSRLGFTTAATSLNRSQPNCARCLAVSWAGRLFIHFRRLLPRNGILPGAKFTLCPPSLALSYIGSVTAWHSSSGREPNVAALSTRATITLGIGPHSSLLLE